MYDDIPEGFSLLPGPSGFSGYPAVDTPEFPTYRDYPPDPLDVYHRGVELLGRAERTPRVILGRTVEDIPGMVKPGTLDLIDRPIVRNKDGSVPTELSFSIEDKGLEVLLPSVVGGQMLNQKDAIEHYRATGEHLGMFKDPASADSYAQALHKWQEVGIPQPYGLNILGPKLKAQEDRLKALKQSFETAPTGKAPIGASPLIPTQEELKGKDFQVGTIQPGNIDLDNLTPVETAGGDLDTLAPAAYTDQQKKQTVLFPTIIDGKEFPVQDAYRDYQKTGKHLGIFKGTVEAIEYRDQLQNRQNQFYGLATAKVMAEDEGRPELAPSNLAPVSKGTAFDTYPSQEDVPDVASNRGLLASTAKGTPIAPPSEEESNRLVDAEQAKSNAQYSDIPEGFSVRPAPAPAQQPGSVRGVATTFGYNDPQDNGIGFWGTPTNNPHVVGVSLSRSALAQHFGPGYEQTAFNKLVQVTNPQTGKTITAPIVDIGPAKWVEDRQGSTIDLTYAANQAVGGTGKTPMEWKVVDYSDIPEGFSMRSEPSRQQSQYSDIPEGFVVAPQPAPATQPSAATQAPPAGYIDIGPKRQPTPAPTTAGPATLQPIAEPGAETPKREVGFWEAANRGLAEEGYGMHRALGQKVIGPAVNDITKLINTIAPGTDFAKYASGLNEEVYNALVTPTGRTGQAIKRQEAKPATEQEGFAAKLGRGLGSMGMDIGVAVPTGMAISAVLPEAAVAAGSEATAGTILNMAKTLLPRMGKAGASFALPALTRGVDAQNRAANAGASPVEQNHEFTKAALETMAWASLPLGVESNARNMLLRILDRTAKSVPLAAALSEAQRGVSNLLNPKQQQPFSWQQLAINSAPIILLSAAMGHNAREVPRGPIAEQAFPKIHIFEDHTVTPPTDFAPKPEVPTHGPRTEAFHGSPFEFEAFDTSKIGSGEGAQAFGYGHYVAERKGVGESYAQSVKKMLVDGKAVEARQGTPEEAALTGVTELGYEKALKEAEDHQAQVYANYEQYHAGEDQVRYAQEVIDEIKKLQGKKVEMSPGNLYRVHVKGDKTNFLDWDKPLSQQSEDVQHALKDANLPDPLVTGANAYHYLEEVARKAGEPHGAKAAAQWLQKRGVLGIRFLDQPSRNVRSPEQISKDIENKKIIIANAKRAAALLTNESERKMDEHIIRGYEHELLDLQKDWLKARQAPPTHNLVVFDPQNIEIIDRNGKKVGTMASPPAEVPTAPPAALPAPTAEEERFAPGAPLPEPAGAGVGLVASPKAAQAMAMAKETGAALKKEHTGLSAIGDFLRAVKNYVFRKQQGVDAIQQMRKELDKVLINKNRAEGVTNYIQAGGDRNVLLARAAASKNLELKKGYEAAANLTPEEVGIASKVQGIFQGYLQKLREAGIEVKEFQNYVNQIWQMEVGAREGTSQPRSLSEYFRFRRHKFFESYFHGEQEGYTPKTKDIRELLATYMNEADHAIASREMVKDLLAGKASDGHPLLLNTGGGRPVEGGEGPTLIFPGTTPKDAPPGVRYQDVPMPALHGWKYATSDSAGNPVLMKGDLRVHPEVAGKLQNLFGQSWLRKYWGTLTDSPTHNAIKGVLKFALDDAQQHMKATIFSLSAFHQTNLGLHALFGHRVNPFGRIGRGIPEIDLVNNPEQMKAAQAGLMLKPDRIGQQYFQEGLAGGDKNLITILLKKIGEKSGVQAATKAANAINNYTDYLFSRYIPGLKYKTYEAVLPRNMTRFKKQLAAGTVTPEQVEHLSADQVNVSYGHLNYAAYGRNPTIQHILSIASIAPDFLESRVRYAGQAISGAYTRKGWEQLQGLAFLAATNWLLARVVNGLNDNGDPHFDHPFEVKIGNRWYGVRSIPEDAYKFATDTGPFIFNRANFAVRAALGWLTGRNWRGEKTGNIDLIKDLLFGAVPLPLQGFTKQFTTTGRSDPLTITDHILSALGVTVHRFSPVTEIASKAKDWEKVHTPEAVQKGSFPPSKYLGIQYALEDGDRLKALQEVQYLKNQKMTLDQIKKGFHERVSHPFTSSQENDARFRLSLGASDRKKYDLAVERKKKLGQRFDLWVR